MVVGTIRLVLGLPGSDSLKSKRKVVRSILDRVRARFNAAAAEVDALDAHRRAVLGFAVVSNDPSHAHSMLDAIAAMVANAGDAVLVERRTELVQLGAGEHMERYGLED
jgi:hypothetical protein